MSNPPQVNEGMGLLLTLERELRRAASLTELGYIIVNDSRRLVDYRQAFLWSLSPTGHLKPLAVSGLGDFDPDAPLVAWVRRLLAIHPGFAGMRESQAFSAAAVSAPWREQWLEWLPQHALWLPLPTPRGEVPGGLLLVRDLPWQDHELQILKLLAESYGYAWMAVTGQPAFGGWRKALPNLRGWRGWALSLLVVGVLFFLPVRLSVLAPAQVIATDPMVVSSPLDGVVDKFFIQPNQRVEEGAPLFRLDDTVLQNRHQIAMKSLAVAIADLERSTRKGFHDEKSMAETALMKAQVALKEAEAAYNAEMLSRVLVSAARAGLAVFNDVNDWVGRPVKVGEKVLTLADPQRAEVEVWLAVEDALILEPGSQVQLFLNIRPADPIAGTVVHTSYEAQQSPQGILSFRLRCRFKEGVPPPRIGLMGTAKLYGEEVSLIYYLLRRPLAALRQRTGW